MMGLNGQTGSLVIFCPFDKFPVVLGLLWGEGVRSRLSISQLLPRRALRQRPILGLRALGQQHPQRVDPERGSERQIKQRDERQDDGQHPRPIQVLQQPPACSYTQDRFDQQKNPDGAEERLKKFGCAGYNASMPENYVGYYHQSNAGQGVYG